MKEEKKIIIVHIIINFEQILSNFCSIHCYYNVSVIYSKQIIFLQLSIFIYIEQNYLLMIKKCLLNVIQKGK